MISIKKGDVWTESHTHRMKTEGEDKLSIRQTERLRTDPSPKPSEGTNPADKLNFDLQPLELWDKKFLSFNPCSLQYSAKPVLAVITKYINYNTMISYVLEKRNIYIYILNEEKF